jgi:ribosomal protein S18 acetylase RimI-like enzyme
MIIARLPRLIARGDLVLRPLRLRDGPFLSAMLKRADILSTCGVRRAPGVSWLSLYARLRSLFFLSYCIEYSSERIGLAGVYDLRADGSVEMALAIFPEARRRMGLGTRAFRMLSSVLEEKRIVRSWIVSVRKDNSAALGFWTKLGFEESSQSKETIRMTLSAGRAGLPRARTIMEDRP